MNVRGYTDYLNKIKKLPMGKKFISINVSVTKKKMFSDKPTFVYLFFNELPNPETGYTWGVNLSSEKPKNKNIILLCELILKDDKLIARNVSKNIPLAHLNFVVSKSNVNFIFLVRN